MNDCFVKRINAYEGDGPNIVKQHNILGHPTLIFIDRNGQEYKRFVGPQTLETLEENLHHIIKN